MSNSQYASVTTGGVFFCGVRVNGTAACGSRNFLARRQPPGGRYKSISSGVFHSCGVRDDDTLACWDNTQTDGHYLCHRPRAVQSAIRQIRFGQQRRVVQLRRQTGRWRDFLLGQEQLRSNAAPVRLIVRRVQPTPGSQLALFASYSYHGFITDREGETLELEADHRRHAEIENAIRDLKYGVGLNHLPSGRFPANGAWLAVQVIAHNLARWTARLGLGEQIVTTKTLRRRFFSIAGRLTRSARRLTLHLPKRWPWENQFSRALARLRAIPLPA